MTALNGLRTVEAAPGKRILVTGASGGVGSCALRIGKALGARMVAVTSDPAKEQSLRGFGADEVVCAREGQGEIELAEIDGVVDAVGGAMFGALVEALKPRGRLCLVGGAGGEAIHLSAWALLREITLTGWSSETLDGPALRRDIATLTRLFHEAHLIPPPTTAIPLSETAAAHRKLESSAHTSGGCCSCRNGRARHEALSGVPLDLASLTMQAFLRSSRVAWYSRAKRYSCMTSKSA